MILGLAILLLFQLLGEAVVRLLALPVPGPVMGMALLFLALLLRGETPEPLSRAAQSLLKILSLLFVPAGVGILAYGALVRQEWLPITAALVIGTLITIAVTALVFRAAIAWLPASARRTTEERP